VLPVSALLADKVGTGEEPGHVVGLFMCLVLETVEFNRWLGAESGTPLDQRCVAKNGVAKNGPFIAATGDVVVAALHVGEGDGVKSMSGSRFFAGGWPWCDQRFC
jgi:hypothetical protein